MTDEQLQRAIYRGQISMVMLMAEHAIKFVSLDDKPTERQKEIMRLLSEEYDEAARKTQTTKEN